LDIKVYEDKTGLIGNTASIAAVGAILYVVIEIPTDIFSLTSPVWHIVSRGCIAVSVTAALIYFAINKLKKEK